MPESPVRVALLARAGDVREQLRHALIELGAEVVAEGDPAELDPGTVASGRPAVVVVSLEPAIEDALAEFDDLLAMPGVQVIYDDAEVTRQLDGWDLARWARHLASKLAGTESALLPPAPRDADRVPETEISLEPGAPPTPAQEMDHHKLEDYAAESLDLSEWVPSTPSLTDVQVSDEPATGSAEEPSPDLDLDLDIDLAGLEEAMTPRPDAATPAARSGSADATEESLDFDAGGTGAAGVTAGSGEDVDLGDFLDLSVADSMELEIAEAPASADGSEPLLVDFEVPEGPIKFSSFSDEEDLSPGAVDDDVAALAAQLDAFEANDALPGPREPDFALAEEPPLMLDDEPAAIEPAPRAAAPAGTGGGGFGNLELMPMDSGQAAVASTPPPAPAFRSAATAEPAKVDFGGLSLADAGASMSENTAAPAPRAAPAAPAKSGLGLAPTEDAAAGLDFKRAATTTPGALLVLAGLGGPDGVRQLLSALPPSLPVPVLLYQHLDTGKHERLVGQLAKASRLPLDLAVEGATAAPGRVAVLPPGIGVSLRDGEFAFAPISSLPALVGALPAAESVVLVLSGGDPAVVASILALKRDGGRVLAQDPASCFDAGAPQALISSGATTAPLPDLARLIIERWS